MARRARRSPRRDLPAEDLRQLAAFRHALRSFLHFSERATAKVGLTGPQYQAMLAVRARGAAAKVTIGDLAAEMLIRHNSAVGLVDRLAALGLMERARAVEDRRKVRLRLTPSGERVLARLASVHRLKLRRISPAILRNLAELAGAWRRGAR